MDSEKTIAQKEHVTELTEKMNDLDNYRQILSKYILNGKTEDTHHFDRAQELLALLKSRISELRNELKAADSGWFGFQLDDLYQELMNSDEVVNDPNAAH